MTPFQFRRGLPAVIVTLLVLVAIAPVPVGAADSRSKASTARPEDMLTEATKDARALAASIAAGGKVAEFCANCHGANGNSTHPDVPNLAGQSARYLLDQTQKFFYGQRPNEYKQGLIKLLSPEDRVHLVVYYASQVPVHQAAPDASLAARGKGLYNEHCADCHGEDGRGDEKIARVAGQQREYLTVSLMRYRERGGERIDPKMARVVRPLTETDIRSLVLYMSAMQ